MISLLALLVAILSQVAYSTTNCTLQVPQNPLTAAGLAQPWILAGGCSMTNSNQQVFVEGTIIDPQTGNVFVYNPLVITSGTTPAIQPVVPVLPDGAIIGLWVGANSNNVVLIGDTVGGNCINGINVGGFLSTFSQVASCNAAQFFAMAQIAQVPPLGKASDGQTCLTTRDFALVDMDQS